MIELSIVKYLCSKEGYTSYRDKLLVSDFPKELQGVIRVLDNHHSLAESVDLSVDDLSNLWFSQSNRDKDYYQGVFEAIKTNEAGTDSVGKLVQGLHRLRTLRELSVSAYDASEGRTSLESVLDKLNKLKDGNDNAANTEDEIQFVSDDLEQLVQNTFSKPGLRWRLNTLNKALGSIRTGDFGFLFSRPESFSRDTEVLTETGWLKVDQVTLETSIAQVQANRTLSFTKPVAIHPHEQEYCYHIHDWLGRVDLIVTEGHGMIVEKEGKWWKERADVVKYGQGVYHHVSASSSNEISIPFTPQHRLEIAYQADGHTRNYKEYGYTFSFNKERKHYRIQEILDQCGYRYTQYKDGNRGNLGYYVYVDTPLHKNFDWVDFKLINKEWCQQFIEELSYWDATRRSNTRYKYDTTNKSVADKVQAIAILAGYNCLMSEFPDNRKETFNTIYSLSIRTNYRPIEGQSIVKERIPFKDTTYCFEVPSGMLLVRRNGATAITGNTGKTTFLASEVTYMAEQLTDEAGPILWLNNEEVGDKVMMRIYQASLGVDLVALHRDLKTNRQRYLDKTRGKIKLYDQAKIHYRTVEKLCERLKPSLIIFDQIDKIIGHDNDREDLRLGAIYQWAREMAKTYAPVIAVCQADGTGEGQRWLTMANVANAKTSKQAEADWILGIGKVSDVGFDALRFLHLSKNKLTGDSDTEKELRHGRLECLINPEIARYVDLT